MIKAVIFDFGGVVVADLYSPLVEKEKQAMSAEEFAEFKKKEILTVRGRLGEKDFINILKNTFGPEKVAALFSKIEPTYQSPNLKVLELIKSLKPKYKIGLLSNIFSFWRKIAERQDYMKLFDVLVFSDAVGQAKPDREIYQTAARLLAVSPNECVFIDNLPENVAGAQKAGMKGLLFTRTAFPRKLCTVLTPCR